MYFLIMLKRCLYLCLFNSVLRQEIWCVRKCKVGIHDISRRRFEYRKITVNEIYKLTDKRIRITQKRSRMKYIMRHTDMLDFCQNECVKII